MGKSGTTNRINLVKCHTKYTFLLSDSYVEVISMTNLKLSDGVVIALLIIFAAIVVYLLSPLIIAVLIIAIGYFVYRWYTNHQRMNRYA